MMGLICNSKLFQKWICSLEGILIDWKPVDIYSFLSQLLSVSPLISHVNVHFCVFASVVMSSTMKSQSDCNITPGPASCSATIYFTLLHQRTPPSPPPILCKALSSKSDVSPVPASCLDNLSFSLLCHDEGAEPICVASLTELTSS